MASASPAVCLRCGAALPPEGVPCPACLLGTGQDSVPAADELLELALRLPSEDRESFLLQAEHEDPALAATVRQRLQSRRDPSDAAPDISWGIHASEEAPGVRIGAFELVRCLGEGGMGTVWEAAQRSPVRRTVALKLIKLGMDTREIVKRFERERQTLALLNHPNIAQVFEAGVTPSGRPYFVMEKVTGCPVTEACIAGLLPLRARLELFLEICAAVEHAHQKGVIHRDLKPSNLLVGGGRVKVIDFGIAKATHEAGDSLLTRRAQILGTPAYMSPEQAQSADADLDTRTDVYALGGILYELLAGAPPFDAARLAQTSLADMQRILLEEDPPPPSERLALRLRVGAAPESGGPRPAELRGDLDRVVMKALRKDRNERYPSAAALADDLRRHLDGEPVLAVPPTLGYRAGKFVRRYRTAVAGAVLTLAAMVSGLVVSVQQAARARQAQRSATLTVADMHARSGLATDAAGDPSRAALWFANAAVIAAGDPVRREANRTRATAWRQTISTPVRALDTGFRYAGELLWNPRQPALIAESDPPGECRIWDLSGDRLWIPGTNSPTRALWDASGDHLIVATGSGIRVLEFPGGLEVARLVCETPHSWAMDPGSDRIAIGAPQPVLWNWRSDERQPLPIRDRVPSDLCFSADGHRLLITWPGSASVVSTTNSGVLLHAPVPHSPQGIALFLGDGSRYATCSAEGRIEVRDAHDGRVIQVHPTPGATPGFARTISSDGRFLARDNAPVLDLSSGTALAIPVHQNLFHEAAFSPDGRLLATGGYDDALKLWDLQAGRLIETVGQHQHAVLRIAWSPDARFVASSQDGLVRIWRIARSSPATAIPTGADSLATLSQDGNLLAPSGFSRRGGALARTRAHQLPSGVPAGPELDPQGLIMDAGFDPDSRWLALAVSTTHDRANTHFPTNRGSGNVQLWDFRSGVRMGSPFVLPSEPRSLAIHASGQWIAVFCSDGQTLEWSVTSNSAATLFRFADPFPPDGTLQNGECAYSPDGRQLATWGTGDGFFLWDREERRLRVEPVPESGTVFDLGFQEHTVLTARASQDSSLDFHRLPDGSPGVVPSIPYSNWPFLVRFHPDGVHLLTAGRDRAGQVWDWRVGRRVGPALPHEGEVMAGAFVPRRPWVVTGGHDGRIRTWEYPSGMPMGPALATPGMVLTLEFTPDARTLVACGFFGGRIELYDWNLLFPDPVLDPEGARLLAELDASATVNSDGGLVPLSAPEWLARWREFRSRHPGFAGHSMQKAMRPMP